MGSRVQILRNEFQLIELNPALDLGSSNHELSFVALFFLVVTN
jgi:hypothetical protein